MFTFFNLFGQPGSEDDPDQATSGSRERKDADETVAAVPLFSQAGEHPQLPKLTTYLQRISNADISCW